MGRSLASPQINLSLMKRVENLIQAREIVARKSMKGGQVFQKIDVEQTVVQKGESHLLQKLPVSSKPGALPRRGPSVSSPSRWTGSTSNASCKRSPHRGRANWMRS
jgi:hypothetical protein